MGWLRDVVDILKDPEVRAIVREAIEAAKLGREVSKRLADGVQEPDVVSLDARKAVADTVAKYDEARTRLLNRFGGKPVSLGFGGGR
jgi:hypothetical protein